MIFKEQVNKLEKLLLKYNTTLKVITVGVISAILSYYFQVSYLEFNLKNILFSILIGFLISTLFKFHIQINKDKAKLRKNEETKTSLIEKLEIYFSIFKHSPISIVITDNLGNIQYINPKFSQVSGYKPHEIIGKNSRIFQSGKTSLETYQNLWGTILKGKNWTGTLLNKRKNEEIYPEEVLISPILNIKKTRIVHYIAIKIDVTKRIEKEEELYELAHFDQLTRLANRRHFYKNLENALVFAEKYNSTIGLFYLDLNKFKEINDTIGHKSGDEVLKETARRLESTLRGSDIISRIGGDEFVILFKNIKTKRNLQNIAEKILTNIGNTPYRISGKKFKIGVSIGICFYQYLKEKKLNIDEIVKYADNAMYEAKKDTNLTKGGKYIFAKFD